MTSSNTAVLLCTVFKKLADNDPEVKAHQGGEGEKRKFIAGYAPCKHRDKDMVKCAIVNFNGRGWMVYPEYRVAIEFYTARLWG